MRFLIFAFIILVLDSYAYAQQIQLQARERQARQSGYMDRAEVRHVAGSATVTANSPRPLAQALTALSEEYAWVIDFEDPPYYSNYDLVDDTDPQWRAAHPTKKGVTVIAGGTFQSQFPENPNTGMALQEEEHILNKTVSDYNASANPGRFNVQNEGDGRFTVVGAYLKDEKGEDRAMIPILNTPVSVPTDTRDAYSTIEIILNALTSKSGTKVGVGMVPLNALHQTQVTVGGQNIPARVLLLQALSASNVKLYWHLYYDNDVNLYMFNVLPLIKASYDASGNRTTALVR